MRCRRIRRELLWLARFGEFGPSSAPHLDHLSRCGACRDEVGFDRALVQQLRVALAERIADEEPSARSWELIRERAQAPERGLRALLRGHALVLAARLRTATAVSAIALAGIIATSTQVIVTHPEAGSAETEVRTSSAGDQYEQRPLIPRPRQTATSARVVYVPASRPHDPEAAFLIGAPMPEITQPATEEAPTQETGIESSVTIVSRIYRLTGSDPVDGQPDPEPAAEGPAPHDDTASGGPY